MYSTAQTLSLISGNSVRVSLLLIILQMLTASTRREFIKHKFSFGSRAMCTVHYLLLNVDQSRLIVTSNQTTLYLYGYSNLLWSGEIQEFFIFIVSIQLG